MFDCFFSKFANERRITDVILYAIRRSIRKDLVRITYVKMVFEYIDYRVVNSFLDGESS